MGTPSSKWFLNFNCIQLNLFFDNFVHVYNVFPLLFLLAPLISSVHLPSSILTSWYVWLHGNLWQYPCSFYVCLFLCLFGGCFVCISLDLTIAMEIPTGAWHVHHWVCNWRGWLPISQSLSIANIQQWQTDPQSSSPHWQLTVKASIAQAHPVQVIAAALRYCAVSAGWDFTALLPTFWLLYSSSPFSAMSPSLKESRINDLSRAGP